MNDHYLDSYIPQDQPQTAPTLISQFATEVFQARGRLSKLAEDMREVANRVCGQAPDVGKANTPPAPVPNGSLDKMREALSHLHRVADELEGQFDRLRNL